MEWVPLSDVQWMNIVNHDKAWESYSKDDAVHEAVKMTEAKCKENNENKWISVEDILPAKDRIVLVLCYHSETHEDEEGNDVYEDKVVVTEGQCIYTDVGPYMDAFQFSRTHITHWQPLPAPPKD